MRFLFYTIFLFVLAAVWTSAHPGVFFATAAGIIALSEVACWIFRALRARRGTSGE